MYADGPACVGLSAVAMPISVAAHHNITHDATNRTRIHNRQQIVSAVIKANRPEQLDAYCPNCRIVIVVQ